MPAFYLLRMFRSAFEFAHRKESRERELYADRIAAICTSANDAAQALLKVTAYSSHRRATELELFEKNLKHDAALGLKERVAGGVVGHVATAQFLETVKTMNVPHPFDSHPPLEERLKNLGSQLTCGDCERFMKETPTTTWADQLPVADGIEDRLWAAYERRFADAHEKSLAYRYLPEGPEEQAVVEKFFPVHVFPSADGGDLRVTYQFVEVPEGTRVFFHDVFSATVQSGNFATNLLVVRNEVGADPVTIRLHKLGNAAVQEKFRALFAQYWGRDTAARDFVAAQSKPASPDA